MMIASTPRPRASSAPSAARPAAPRSNRGLSLIHICGDVLSGLGGSLLALPETQLMTAALGLGTMALILILRRVNPRLPGALVAIAAATLVVFLLGDRAADVAVIGRLPAGLPPPANLPLFNLEMIGRLSTGALAVAAIGLVQTTAVSRAAASQTRQRLDNNQEFIGQGMANIFSGLFSGYATSGSFSVTAVKYRAGAKTRLASLVACVAVSYTHLFHDS